MLRYREITPEDIGELAKLFTETFNAPPWNEHWTEETSARRLRQMIYTEDFYGLCFFQEQELCGLILGSMEQYYDEMHFQIKEFCVKNRLRGQHIGSQVLDEFERRLKHLGISKTLLLTSRHDATEGFYRRKGYTSSDHMILMEKQWP